MGDEEQLSSQNRLPHTIRAMVAANLRGVFEEWLATQTKEPEDASNILNKLDIAALDDPEADAAYDWAVTRMIRCGAITKDSLAKLVRTSADLEKEIVKKMEEKS